MAASGRTSDDPFPLPGSARIRGFFIFPLDIISVPNYNAIVRYLILWTIPLKGAMINDEQPEP